MRNIPQPGTVWSSWRKRGIEKPRAQTNGAALTAGPPRRHHTEDPSNSTRSCTLVESNIITLTGSYIKRTLHTPPTFGMESQIWQFVTLMLFNYTESFQ